MNRKRLVKATLIAGLFFLSLGGWLLHLRIHPITKSPANAIPFISGIVSIFFLPLLFWFRRTITLAYIINGFLVITGTIFMVYFSIDHFIGPVTAANILMNTLFADIAVLWCKFAIGKALFGLELLKSEADMSPKGRFFRHPNMGWWWVHLVALTIVFTLGKILWK